MTRRIESECPHCCDVFPVAAGVAEELEVVATTEGSENAVVELCCPLGHPFLVSLKTLRISC